MKIFALSLLMLLGYQTSHAASSCLLLFTATSPAVWSSSCEFTIQASSLCDGAEKYSALGSKKITVSFTQGKSCEEGAFQWVKNKTAYDSLRTAQITKLLGAGYELYNVKEVDSHAMYLFIKK